MQLSEGVSAQGACWSFRGACSSVRALLAVRGERAERVVSLPVRLAIPVRVLAPKLPPNSGYACFLFL